MRQSPQLVLVERMLGALARLDAEGVLECLSHDVCGLDEVTTSFVRGHHAMSAYVHDLVNRAPAVTSRILDYHEIITDDAAFVTCRLHQTYTLDGVEHVIAAPTTYGFKVVDDTWKICLFHSVSTSDTVAG